MARRLSRQEVLRRLIPSRNKPFSTPAPKFTRSAWPKWVEPYIVALIAATRRPEQFGEDLRRWIHVGASPRGTLALYKVSRARAWLSGRDHVTPDDVRAVVHDGLRHRIILSYEANADGLSADDVINEVLKQVAVA